MPALKALTPLAAVRSVMAEVALLVGEQEAPDIYKLSEEADVEVGPFTVSMPRLWQASVKVSRRSW